MEKKAISLILITLLILSSLPMNLATDTGSCRTALGYIREDLEPIAFEAISEEDASINPDSLKNFISVSNKAIRSAGTTEKEKQTIALLSLIVLRAESPLGELDQIDLSLLNTILSALPDRAAIKKAKDDYAKSLGERPEAKEPLNAKGNDIRALIGYLSKTNTLEELDKELQGIRKVIGTDILSIEDLLSKWSEIPDNLAKLTKREAEKKVNEELFSRLSELVEDSVMRSYLPFMSPALIEKIGKEVLAKKSAAELKKLFETIPEYQLPLLMAIFDKGKFDVIAKLKSIDAEFGKELDSIDLTRYSQEEKKAITKLKETITQI
ncbi:hypothetical protein DRQ29_00735, partial [bacterium]